MSTIWVARSGFAQKDVVDFFNQIAMFSVTGLAVSMMLVVQCGLRVYPWF